MRGALLPRSGHETGGAGCTRRWFVVVGFFGDGGFASINGHEKGPGSLPGLRIS